MTTTAEEVREAERRVLRSSVWHLTQTASDSGERLGKVAASPYVTAVEREMALRALQRMYEALGVVDQLSASLAPAVDERT